MLVCTHRRQIFGWVLVLPSLGLSIVCSHIDSRVENKKNYQLFAQCTCVFGTHMVFSTKCNLQCCKQKCSEPFALHIPFTSEPFALVLKTCTWHALLSVYHDILPLILFLSNRPRPQPHWALPDIFFVFPTRAWAQHRSARTQGGGGHAAQNTSPVAGAEVAAQSKAVVVVVAAHGGEVGGALCSAAAPVTSTWRPHRSTHRSCTPCKSGREQKKGGGGIKQCRHAGGCK